MAAKFGYTFMWVDDVMKTVEFYENAFGLQRRSIRENGPMGLFAELETGDTTLAIADVKEANAIFPGGYRKNGTTEIPGAFQVTFITSQVAETYQAALAAGATPQTEPTLHPWGQTIARIRDINGIFVSIASPLLN